MAEFSAKERDVLQLLRDYRSFISNFGGAMPLEETGVVDASYGPAGVLLTGAGFRKGDVPGLLRSYRALAVALTFLRRDHFQEWGALVEPYLSDVADAGVVGDWRRKTAALDEENAAIRRRNVEIREENARRRKKGRPERPEKHEKVGLVFARVQLERHDSAVKRLARYLRDVDLHVVNPTLMSAGEEAAGDAANAQVHAYYQQVRVSGRRHAAAVAAAAWKFGISDGEVERIIEFREDVRLATCAEEGCDNAVYSQNLCQKHYQQRWRERRKGEGKAAG